MGAPLDESSRWREIYVQLRRKAPSEVSLTALQPSGLLEQHTIVLRARPAEPGHWMQQADVPLEGATLGLQQDSRGLLRLAFSLQPSASPQKWILHSKLPKRSQLPPPAPPSCPTPPPALPSVPPPEPPTAPLPPEAT